MKETKYRELLNSRRVEYKGYVPTYCIAIRAYVFFNADGFNHLRFRTDGSPRKQDEQMYKLGLLPLVISVIKSATSVEKYQRRMSPVGRKKENGVRIMKEIEYWAIIAIVGRQNVKLKVVLRRIGTGKIHFWSVMKLGQNQKHPLL